MSLSDEMSSSLSILRTKVGHDYYLYDYIDFMHNHVDSYITISKVEYSSKTKNWTEKSYFVSEWYKYIEFRDDIDLYHSVNTFYRPKRGTKLVRYVNAVYADIDCYKNDDTQENALHKINQLVKDGKLPKPSLVVNSGRGLYLIWKIESAPGKFVRVQKLYNHVQKHINKVLNDNDVFADPGALDIARVLRLPGTVNTKNRKKVEIIEAAETIYTLKFFQQLMNETNDYDEYLRSKTKVKRNNEKPNLIRLFTEYSLAIARARDLEKLVELRNKDVEGWRNKFMRVYSYQMNIIHKDYYVARERTLDFNQEFEVPLLIQEINDISKTCTKAYREHEKDIKKGYNYKNETLIRLLEIDQQEQEQMQTIISKEEYQKRQRKYQYDKRRDESGKTEAERLRAQKMERAKELYYKQGYKKKDIAQELRVTERTITRYIKTGTL